MSVVKTQPKEKRVKKEPPASQTRRTYFMGAITLVLAIGLPTKEMDKAFMVVAAIIAIYIYISYKAYKKEKEAEERRKEMERLEKLRRSEEEKRKAAQKEAEEKAALTAMPKENPNEPRAEQVKGEKYAKFVGSAFKRLNYDVEYRAIELTDSDAVHLTAARANELCLIHCAKNSNEIQATEFEMFIHDCESFRRKHKFWQDDIKYIFVVSGGVSQEAIDFIAEQRKRNIPIEYRVFAVS